MRRYGLSLISEPLEPTGIGTHGLELAQAIAPLLAADERLVVFRHERFPAPASHERVEDAALRFPAGRSAARRAAEQLLLPLEAARRRLTLVHALNHVAPLASPVPVVLTVNDTRLFAGRGRAGLARRLFRGLVYPASLRRAARVIAISEWTAEQCAAAFGLARERFSVIPLGVDHDAFARVTPADRARVAAALGVAGPFILFAGALEPNKNVLRLVEAFAEVAARAVLVLAGSGGALREAVLERVRARGLEARVRVAAYVPRADFPAILASARVLALPSLEEGFGLPVLEAFAAGTPVLTSNRAALAEIVEGAALVVDPEDPRAIAAGLARLLSDDSLARDLAARGRARAAAYTWEKTAAATLAIYRSLARAPLAGRAGAP